MSHRTDILRTLAEDQAATPGERAAARKALGIHERRARNIPPLPTPEQVPLPESGADDVLLMFGDGRWSLVIADYMVGTWPGSCSIRLPEPDIEAGYMGLPHVRRYGFLKIEAEMSKCDRNTVGHFQRFIQRRRGHIQVVLTATDGAWMFAEAWCEQYRVMPSMRDGHLYDVELVIRAKEESPSFKRASQRSLPVGRLALPEAR